MFANRNKNQTVNKANAAGPQTSRSNQSALSNYSSNINPIRQNSTLLQETKSSARKSVSREAAYQVNPRNTKPLDLPMQMNARATSAALREVEKNAAPEDGEKPRMSMSDLQKQYENRIDFY